MAVESAIERLRFLLLQVRNPDDPMRTHEVGCFSRVLGVSAERISVYDLLCGAPGERLIRDCDLVLMGGSGHYSAAGEGKWLDEALATLREIHRLKKPCFASCWGFQAMARALGGRVIHDLAHAEVGTHRLWLTEAGRRDPVFAPLGEGFNGQMGHEDHVVELPPGAILLASSERVTNQAYCFDDRPIYCTQFHPELRADDLYLRVRVYPEYIEKIAGLPPERFGELIAESPESEQILSRFVKLVFGD